MEGLLIALAVLLFIAVAALVWVLPWVSITGEAKLAEARRMGVDPGRRPRLATLLVPIVAAGSVFLGVSQGIIHASPLVGVCVAAWFATFWVLARWGWNLPRITTPYLVAVLSYTVAVMLAARFTDVLGSKSSWGGLEFVVFDSAVLLMLPYARRRIWAERSRRRSAT